MSARSAEMPCWNQVVQISLLLLVSREGTAACWSSPPVRSFFTLHYMISVRFSFFLFFGFVIISAVLGSTLLSQIGGQELAECFDQRYLWSDSPIKLQHHKGLSEKWNDYDFRACSKAVRLTFCPLWNVRRRPGTTQYFDSDKRNHALIISYAIWKSGHCWNMLLDVLGNRRL